MDPRILERDAPLNTSIRQVWPFALENIANELVI